ncbi:VanZ family protein [Segetibacter koreensis]|uniref:VanZ family protein n=1 Tax=Segetibacter koreensis TaxID=398037 RepID=UPI0003684C21|nr:VanZ family protein [Segetibacter koreensis]
MRAIYFIPAIIWFIISIVLLTLPGNDLPHNSFFDLPFFDKYVHFGMFFLLTVLFSFPFYKLPAKPTAVISIFYKVSFFVILYGVIMEFVQKFFTFERSFDVVDILFDSLGSLAGLFAIRQIFYKKIGPNENRGRNQN